MKAKPPVFDDIKYEEACRELGKQLAAMAIEDDLVDQADEIDECLGNTLEDIRMYTNEILDKLRKPKRKGKR